MIIGVKNLTWAKFKSGGDGTAPVYEGGKMDKDKMVRADQSEDRANGKFYADDHQIDGDNSVTAAHVALELAKLGEDMLTDMFGYAANGTDLVMSDQEAPYVGVGFVFVDRYKGEKSYVPYWYYKVQFSLGSRSFNTKGENVDFQTESAEGEAMSIQQDSTGRNDFYARPKTAFKTETEAVEWLKTKAGISA